MLDEQLLYASGWRQRGQRFDSCRICHRSGDDNLGWRSPAYAFYHAHCLEESRRYKQMVKKAERETGQGLHRAATGTKLVLDNLTRVSV